MMIHNISDKELQGKMQRIEELFRLGFNVPDYYLVHDKATLRELKEELFQRNERMSIRTYSKTDELKEFKCPHYPNWPVSELLEMIDDLQEKYFILASPPIDPQKALFAGNVVTPAYGEEDVVFEFITGPGTVRDVEKRGRTMIVKRKGEIHVDGERQECLELVRNQILKFPTERTIIEFSVYSENVGKMQHDTVYWEHRPF
jgi:hypothetical protein